MKFTILKKQNNLKTDLFYREDQCSFNSKPSSDWCYTTVQINELQLDVDYNGKVLHVWGYCPMGIYSETSLYPINFTHHAIRVIPDEEFEPGMSMKYNNKERWSIHINHKLGWVCIGNPKVDNVKMIEFASNSIATFEKENLIAIWLKPIFL